MYAWICIVMHVTHVLSLTLSCIFMYIYISSSWLMHFISDGIPSIVMNYQIRPDDRMGLCIEKLLYLFCFFYRNYETSHFSETFWNLWLPYTFKITKKKIVCKCFTWCAWKESITVSFNMWIHKMTEKIMWVETTLLLFLKKTFIVNFQEHFCAHIFMMQ